MTKDIKQIQEWQPIETAPVSGESFIGYGSFSKSTFKQTFIAHYDSGGFTEGWVEKFGMSHLYLTHWQPLPTPPVEAELGGEGE